MKRLSILALAGLAACTPTLGLDPTPHASDPVCAQMLMATPGEIGGFTRVNTTSQSTTAWADGSSFRCGLDQPGPSTDRCITVGGIDWLSLDSGDERIPDNGGDDTWTFLSYGRQPTVEIVITTDAVGAGAVTDVLAQFSSALSIVEPQRECLALVDAPLSVEDDSD
ncbi:DUF3515 family protein [Flaviflexus huanghaiensis]|uniref:DUF3515 family protein n=1 Tax=Flaviflexus huanghaiensis TaxID=1111473 RepID=UPI0015F8768C